MKTIRMMAGLLLGFIIASGMSGAEVSAAPCNCSTPQKGMWIGAQDNFASGGDNPAPSPSQTLLNYLGINTSMPFDSTKLNKKFAHTFTGLPNGITCAELTVHLKPNTYSSKHMSGNDTINLGFISSGGAWDYSSRIGSTTSITGLLPKPWGNESGNYPNGKTITIQLSPGIINGMNTNGLLDVYIQDDTSVDYIRLDMCWTIPSPLPIDLAIEKSELEMNPGTSIFTIKVTNIGGQLPAGSTISVTDSLPGCMDLSGITNNNSGWTCSPSSGNGPLSLTCNNVLTAPLATNASLSFSLLVQKSSSSCKNCAEVSVTGAGGHDVNLDNNHSCAPPEITGEHYQCYDVKQMDHFQPNSVTLKDQFGATKTETLRPKYLCTPVDKNDEGILNEKNHLMCYDIKKTEPVNKHVKVTNQFGSQEYIVNDARVLCVPSLKEVISSNGQCTPPPSGMVSWWDADAVNGTTATDIQGSNSGTLTNGAAAVLGKVGQAFSFDGVNDYVQMTTPYKFDHGQDFTIDLWVMKPQFSSVHRSYILDTRQGTLFGTALVIRPDKTMVLGGRCNNYDTGFNAFSTSKILSDDQWHHITAVIDWAANESRLYIDGNLEDTGNLTNCDSFTNSDKFFLGAVGDLTPSLFFEGSIDEVEVFDRVLSASEIYDIYSAGSAGKCKTEQGKICGYKFNDLDGNGTWSKPQEPGLQGWEITVTDAAGQSVGTATTDTNGKYCIAVPASTTAYTVTEDIQSQGGNWMQTAPATPGTHNASVAAGQTVNNINFGNQKKTPIKPNMTIEKTALKAPWQAGNTGTFEISATSPWTITGTPSVPIIIKDIVPNPPFSLSATQPNNAPWVCNDPSNPFISQYVIYYPNSGSVAPPDWFVCTLDTTAPNTVNAGDPLPPIHLNVDIDPAYKGGVVHNCAEIGHGTAAPPLWHQDQGCVDVPVGAMKKRTTPTHSPNVNIEKKHSPNRFSTGSKGTFSIKVTNKGKTLTRGMLKVSDHMPAGLTVQSGKFRADLWTCEGGMVSSSGQDVTCVFNKRLRKNRWSAIKLDTSIAPNSQFPAGVNTVRNCATATVYGAADVVIAKSQACDEVRIKHADSGGATIPGVFPPAASSPHISIEKKHSPSHFSTGSRGAFKIIVKNLDKKLEKGALTLVDHMPGGLSVKIGTFRAGSWLCHGGMISGSGQDVTCSYNRALNKRGRATLNLNATVAPKAQFPADVDGVENCVTASVQGSAGVKACDRVMIRSVSKSGMSDLAPLGGLIMQMPRGGGRPTRKVPGAVP